MSYPVEYVRYLNFPPLPEEILKDINWNFNEYKKLQRGNYVWSDSFNQAINSWAQKNICPTMYFAFQIMDSDLAMHKDIGTKVKLNYILDPGGAAVATEFYNDNQKLVQSVVLEPHRWHIMKADTFHAVSGIEEGKIRFAITSRIFEWSMHELVTEEGLASKTPTVRGD